MNAPEAVSMARRFSVDLNADLGEGFPNDRQLLERITSAGICCGAHAGDSASIRRTLDAAKELGVIVGAHPGFPDREGFGRREQTATAAEVERLILRQVEDLARLAENSGIEIRFLKPHGALYNQAQRQPEIAQGVVAAIRRLKLPLFGQPGTLLESLAREAEIRYVAEGFPDRRYRPDGSLVPRSDPTALLHDPAEMAEHIERLLDSQNAIETLCIHGDDPAAVENVERVRQVLQSLGIEIKGFLDRAG